jgi:hypothetical protein
MVATRDVFRIDDGEEARLTPGGPHAAVIVSRGYLPLRYREEGTQTRAAFPGTCVTLGFRRRDEPGDGAAGVPSQTELRRPHPPDGEGQYEVVAETAEGETVTYGLRPWPGGEVVRQVVAYTPQLVRAAQQERRRAAVREKAAPHHWLLAPLLGLLPEERQARACSAVGLHAGTATAMSGALETLAVYFGFRSFLSPATEQNAGLDVYLWAIVVPAVVGFAILSAAWRGFWGLAAGEAAGSALLAPFFALVDVVQARLHDPTLVPLTRSAFWARLALPDRLVREKSGAVLVRSLLPHVSWENTKRVRFGDDWWEVATVGAASERGRLIHQYRLTPPPDARTAPAPHDYADDVHAAAARGWDDLFSAGAGLALTLLPEAVQRRAFGSRGGTAAALARTVVTALAQVAFGVWLARTGLAGAPLVAAWCAGEGAFRLYRVATGRFAPSLLGHAFADLLPPEREPYLTHLDAEARALRGA